MNLIDNKNNITIGTKDLIEIFNRYNINISINNLEIYQKAFIHRSFLVNKKQQKTNSSPLDSFNESNERYELLGDCILGCIVGTYLFTRFGDKNEGDLTKLKIKIIKSSTLGYLSTKMNLGKFLIISNPVEVENGRENMRILEDLFESFIGAIYLDNRNNEIDSDWFNNIKIIKSIENELTDIETKLKNSFSVELLNTYIDKNKLYRDYINIILNDKSNGFYICQKFIINIIETELDILQLLQINDNYKDQLQQYFLKNYKNIFPKWEVLNIDGPTYNRIYTIGIKDDKGIFIGIGKSKKKIDAEQLASKEALKYLGFEII